MEGREESSQKEKDGDNRTLNKFNQPKKPCYLQIKVEVAELHSGPGLDRGNDPLAVDVRGVGQLQQRAVAWTGHHAVRLIYKEALVPP